MKKLISLLLALILVCSLLPLSAMAAETPAASGSNPGVVKPSKPGYTGSIWEERPIPEHPSVMDHDNFSWNCNTKYHWKQCVCGAHIGEEPHVALEDAVNDYCICGYHFSDNADLVTLWIDGCPAIKGFNKDTTEYKLKAFTYKDVEEIKVSTRTYDSEATVELPEDLTLKEGENKFDIKVTSENQKVTKIYTVIITKEAKK